MSHNPPDPRRGSVFKLRLLIWVQMLTFLLACTGCPDTASDPSAVPSVSSATSRAEAPPKPASLKALPASPKPASPKALPATPVACEAEQGTNPTFSADGRLLGLLFDQKVRVMDTRTWRRVTTLNFDGTPDRLEFSPDGRFLFALTDSSDLPDARLLSAMRVRDGKRMWRRHVADNARSFVIAKNSRWFAAVVAKPATAKDSEDEELDPSDATPSWHAELFALPSFATRRRFSAPAQITELERPDWEPRKVPDPYNVVSPRGGMEVILPISNEPADYSVDTTQAGECCELVASPDSTTLAISYADVTSLVDTNRGSVLTSLAGAAPSFSPSGRFAVLGRKSHAVAIFDKRRRSAKLFYDALCRIDLSHDSAGPDFSPDESLVAIGGVDHTLCLVSPATARLQSTVPKELSPPQPSIHRGRVSPGGWTKDGSAIVRQGSFSSSLFRVETGKEIPIQLDASSASSFRRRSDGSHIAYDFNSLALAEISGGDVRMFSAPRTGCAPSVISPDGDKAVDGSTGVQTLCATRTLGPIAELDGDGQFEFDPSSRFVHTIDGQSFTVWSSTTGKQLFRLAFCPR